MIAQTRQIEAAARKAVRDGLILASEIPAVVATASRELVCRGVTYLGSETIRAPRQWATTDYSKMSEASMRGL